MFLTDLRTKAKQFDFEGLEESLIRDQIVLGVDDDSLRERLLRESDLKHYSATNMCRAHEKSKIQLKNLKSVAAAPSELERNTEVDAINREKRKHFKQTKQKQQYESYQRKNEKNMYKVWFQCPQCRSCVPSDGNYVQKMRKTEPLEQML